MKEGTAIREDMIEMFREARAKGLWFYTHYQNLWFSPDELESNQKDGLFRWGPTNWQLRDPQECEQDLRAKIADAEAALELFKKKIGTPLTSAK